jgi:hypothetical protein
MILDDLYASEINDRYLVIKELADKAVALRGRPAPSRAAINWSSYQHTRSRRNARRF